MTEKIFINGEGAIMGRLCSFAAKKALEGKEIVVVNSEKVVVSGNKKDIIKEYGEMRKKGKGHSLKGPRYSRMPYKMLKRAIRGMLPNHRKGIGKEAYLRIKCYNGLPEEFKDKEMIKITTPKKIKYIILEELSKEI
ncbi:50S ribosomal protein L13 [Candidatus Pacearchaeota archaeon]|nr:50S ribosomal protein L13 [Candidatus Pacearchaeota archaeon]